MINDVCSQPVVNKEVRYEDRESRIQKISARGRNNRFSLHSRRNPVRPAHAETTGREQQAGDSFKIRRHTDSDRFG
jgi:hypothetical protein